MTVAAVMSTVLVGCGSEHRSGTTPKPSPSRTRAASPQAGRPLEKADPGAPKVAPGPGGLTPVFRRATGPAGKAVALTFDADMTADQGARAGGGERFDNPALIDSLRSLSVPSTVFMTGRWAEEYPDQAKQIGNDPLFEIANHSYSHYAFASPCYGLPVIGRQDMRADVERAFAAFRKVGARRVVPYFRFPGGCYDERALRAIGPAGVTAVQWDVVSGDAFATDADAVAEQVLAEVKPGSVVVMHCTRSAAPVTAQAVRTIVPELRRRGYHLVKVSDLMRTGARRSAARADRLQRSARGVGRGSFAGPVGAPVTAVAAGSPTSHPGRLATAAADNRAGAGCSGRWMPSRNRRTAGPHAMRTQDTEVHP